MNLEQFSPSFEQFSPETQKAIDSFRREAAPLIHKISQEVVLGMTSSPSKYCLSEISYLIGVQRAEGWLMARGAREEEIYDASRFLRINNYFLIKQQS